MPKLAGGGQSSGDETQVRLGNEYPYPLSIRLPRRIILSVLTLRKGVKSQKQVVINRHRKARGKNQGMWRQHRSR